MPSSNFYTVLAPSIFTTYPKPFQSTHFQYSYNTWRSEHIVKFLIHISSPGTISTCWPTYFSKSRDISCISQRVKIKFAVFYNFVRHEWVNMCSIYESWLLSRTEDWGSISGRDVISCTFKTTFKTALTKSSWVCFSDCKDILRWKTGIPQLVVPIQNGLNLFISMCQHQEVFLFSKTSSRTLRPTQWVAEALSPGGKAPSWPLTSVSRRSSEWVQPYTNSQSTATPLSVQLPPNPNGSTAPSGPELPLYRGFTITLISTHHTQ